MLYEKIKKISDRYREIEQSITLPEVISDNAKYTKLMKEYSLLSPIMEKYNECTAIEKSISDAEEIMNDRSAEADLRALAEDEYRSGISALDEAKNELKMLLVPRDSNDTRNVVVEIRQGAGGEEAALFAADIYRMYYMYAASLSFRVEVLNLNETELGGIKEITFSLSGVGAYSKFKFESGVHRVQRIPVTESNGKIQTSTVTVAVLPEAEEVEVQVNPADIKIESCKSSGAGGQHVNKTESAVRLTHKPTGIVIECDAERSQIQNRARAMRILYTKLYDMKEREQKDAIDKTRKTQVGTGERSEKIRTYNYPQSRVTDHRIGKTVHSLTAFMNGDMDSIISELIAADMAEKYGDM